MSTLRLLSKTSSRFQKTSKKVYPFLLLTACCVFILFQSSSNVLAQTSQARTGSPTIIQNSLLSPISIVQIRQELSRRGLSEVEFRARLIQRGIVLENIPPQELPLYRNIILEVIDEMNQEEGDQSNSPFLMDLRNNEELNLLSLRDSLELLNERAPDIYGHSLFRAGNLSDFVSLESPEVPLDYVLGDGDRVLVSIFGTSQVDQLLEINDQGFVQPINMSKIFLRGLTYAQAKRLLENRYSNYYTFSADEFAVTVQNTRPATLHIIGEAKRKGSFTLSPINSVLNALYVAGGPDSVGTVRELQLVRGKEKKVFDLYASLTDPSILSSFGLKDQDILFIPPAGNIVRIEGAVQRPMRYEMLDQEGVKQLVSYAGGLTPEGYTELAQIERRVNGRIEFLDVHLDDSTTFLKNGDIVRIRSIQNTSSVKVSVLGSVYFPGIYGYAEDETLDDLIQKAGGLLPNAASRAFLERRNPIDTTQVRYLPIDLENPVDNLLKLQSLDVLRVYNKSNYTNIAEVGITGAVKKTVMLSYSPDLNVKELFLAAEGVQFGAALNRIQVFRRNLYQDRAIEYEELIIQVDSSYQVIEPSNFTLQPFDQIVVRQTPGFELETMVEINGEVNYPGTYILENRTTHLSELIRKAGGLRDQADPIGSILYRTFGDRGYVVIDLNEASANPRNQQYDPILLPGDVLTINRRENTVTIKGEGVRLRIATEDTLSQENVTVTFQGQRKADWYIEQYAGGFHKDADLNSVTVRLKNGQVKATKKRLFGRKYPYVEPGATIEVDMKPEAIILVEREKVNWDEVFNRTIQTTTSIVTLLILTKQI